MPTVWKIILNNFTAIWKAVEYKYLCSTLSFLITSLFLCVSFPIQSLSRWPRRNLPRSRRRVFSFLPQCQTSHPSFSPFWMENRDELFVVSSSFPSLDPRPRQKPKAVSDSGIWVCLQNNFSFIPSLSFRLPSFRTLGIARN